MKREDRKDIHLDVVYDLSTLIRDHLLSAAREQYTPSGDGQTKAKELRRLREEFENITTGIISPY